VHRLGRHDEEIAALLEADGSLLAINRHRLVEALEEIDAEGGEADVLRQREEPAHTARGAWRRCLGISRIALDDRDAAGLGVGPQEIGRRRADGAAADHYDIVALQSLELRP